MTDSDLLEELQAENARLIALLEANAIEWRLPAAVPATPVSVVELPTQSLGTKAKLKLFQRLFLGRTDVFPQRWESKAGKAGYSPACANEWRPGVCQKPKIKCGECSHRQLVPLDEQVLYRHLAGEIVAGVYPLLTDDTCNFLAVDFDEADWRDDLLGFAQSCRELDVPVALEISRSGNGAHAWVFFARAVTAQDARRLGTAIISHTCARTRQLKLSSYDRLFPNQDRMPKGGFGNLIALPLQKKAREYGCSVFVDDELKPYVDQWAFLASIQPMAVEDIDPAIVCATGHAHPLDVTFVAEEDEQEPWKNPSEKRLSCPMPASLTVTLANLIYFEKEGLPQALANRLVRLAAFQNPEFYKAQAMRLSVWNKPRIIGCADNFPKHIALPRGCLDVVLELLNENGIAPIIEDERFGGDPINLNFVGALREDQEAAVTAMLQHDAGILCAPTAFGKTVAAAALIARRGVNTLVLVHRTDLLRQWQERLQAFLGLGKGVVGTIGGGKAKPTGIIDIAVMQSLSRQGQVSEQVKNYGQVIVDECHHLSAFSFEAILKNVRAKYVLGLTATPVRRDGQHPIIFMQCGPIRHTASRPTSAPDDLLVETVLLPAPINLPEGAGIQDVFRHLAENIERTERVTLEVEKAFNQGRKVLVLTERTDHLSIIEAALVGRVQNLFTLHGRMSKKQRIALTDELAALPPDVSRVLLATGKLIGEGFDHPPLDTLVLAMPISWKGTLQQYAGRLHREHASKSDVRIIEFIDGGHPALMRMWDKRQSGYRAMGYRIEDRSSSMELFRN
ncbi:MULTISPECIES: TOTE conflict system archaeo-eukaryotic primase domain-containing protein [Pseudomonas]|uniref:DEAD/DEAH box helicase n=2 Tax=Pseudomonas TaxID=286 RepID=A0A7X2BTU2_9PSED|nr:MULTISPECIES: DEAD/DEAH box helicase [Pseudomonas]MQT74651.1 DEAD/DEAH box helicase [Pseudomonas helleri]MQT95553.1 DEAD/DEAH box helicase [Pseudomonas helleri]MQU32192.1 DEAD/DEAH box helicase [Pseudomonas helleri]NMX47060.1 DEAD/DEAH box helicase family protein [Pseudomonas sp. WS 5407]NNB32793.1 DEAD/DEAH box helicase family protein [Pseudomonas fragi]